MHDPRNPCHCSTSVILSQFNEFLLGMCMQAVGGGSAVHHAFQRGSVQSGGAEVGEHDGGPQGRAASPPSRVGGRLDDGLVGVLCLEPAPRSPPQASSLLAVGRSFPCSHLVMDELTSFSHSAVTLVKAKGPSLSFAVCIINCREIH